MKYQLTRKMGSTQIIISGESDAQMEFFKTAHFFSEIPDVCKHCKSTNLRFLYRQPQGYEYASIMCNDCQHELKFGQYKDTKGLFAKGWEPPHQEDGK